MKGPYIKNKWKILKAVRWSVQDQHLFTGAFMYVQDQSLVSILEVDTFSSGNDESQLQ